MSCSYREVENARRKRDVDELAAQAQALGLYPRARGYAPLRSTDVAVRTEGSSGMAALFDLLGLGDVRDLDIAEAWRPRPNRDRRRTPEVT